MLRQVVYNYNTMTFSIPAADGNIVLPFSVAAFTPVLFSYSAPASYHL